MVAFLFFGRLDPGEMVILTILCWLFALTLLLANRRVSLNTRIFAGLLILAAMFVPARTIVKLFPGRLQSTPFGSNIALTLFLVFSLAMIIVAFLLYSALTSYTERGDRDEGEAYLDRWSAGGRGGVVALILCTLILVKAFHYLYWLMVWDATYDALGYIWLFIPSLAVLFSGVMLIIVLPPKFKPAGFLYLLLIPALVIVSSYAQRVNFRKLTEDRAEAISQAIDAYYARNGRYPQKLGQLIPRSMRSIPEPVVIFGQDWCYQGGENFYRLAYIDREHWSAPNIFAQVYKSSGELGDLQPACADQAVILLDRYPESILSFGE